MYPARTSNRWLRTSASAGSSRRVRTNKVDMRNIRAAYVADGDRLNRITGSRPFGRAQLDVAEADLAGPDLARHGDAERDASVLVGRVAVAAHEQVVEVQPDLGAPDHETDD